jgi:hypothetical protein
MTLTEDTLATLSTALPRQACPTEIGIGDVVQFRGVPIPVIVTGSDLAGDSAPYRRVFPWISQARTSNGRPVLEDLQVIEPGETVVLIARGETVHADQVVDGDVLLFEDRASAYGIVIDAPKFSRPGVLDIAWTSGVLPSGMPQTIGFLQKAPSELVRRAARGVTL